LIKLSRLAGYEDVNDRERLFHDLAMRAVVGRKALKRNAASSQTVSRFETETLATDENLKALQAISHAWVGKAMRVTKARKITLDMDSSESPVHGNQEGSAQGGHSYRDAPTPSSVSTSSGIAKARS
jgi:hypothetical protein